MDTELTLTKNGCLLKAVWNPESQKYDSVDVTHAPISQVAFNVCSLDQGVTLRSILLYLNHNLSLWDTILGNWCEEFVKAGLASEGIPYTGTYDPDGIEYLELYWNLAQDAVWEEDKHNPDKTYLQGSKRPDLHGVGYEIQEDIHYQWSKPENPAIMYSKGSRINWGLSFQSIDQLINLPLRLKSEVTIYNEAEYWRKRSAEIIEVVHFTHSQYTLLDILNGLLWEISFHGSPEETKKEKERILNEISERIDD
jgi:hypothetical protein